MYRFDAWLDVALEQAQKSYDEGGLPIGAALVDPSQPTLASQVIAVGHNRRVQDGDPTSHGETDCLRNAGRRRDWHKLTLVTTLSPCIMCSGTALLYRIPRIVIGESENYLGAEDLLEQRGVELVHREHAGCKALMAKFIAEKPDLWNEDIGV
ncbi:MAG: nucleoside deaminase [Phycisphaerales bacterium JB063]